MHSIRNDEWLTLFSSSGVITQNGRQVVRLSGKRLKDVLRRNAENIKAKKANALPPNGTHSPEVHSDVYK